ncbi:MAG: integrase arm-type DNA-binding domain-containing protein [Syntrophales bacterium]|jgi:integrase|nr:integrase arm-type DNA-binding domain-containing protein [Syntrophales bacterium]
MPKRSAPLSEEKINSAKTAEKAYRLFDGLGLFLLVEPNGSRRWRFKYCFEGKEKMISFGIYPEVSLKDARSSRDAARTLLRQGIDPSALRKEYREREKSKLWKIERTPSVRTTIDEQSESRKARNMPLSDMRVRTAKPREKAYKLSDGDGLYLLVTEKGQKWWRFRYRFDGREKLLSMGTYPEISLADARARRDEARRQVAHHIDPGALRKAQKQAETAETETFEVIAREWHEKFKVNWTDGHATTIMSRLERDLFPWIGKRPIMEIKAPELLTVLRRVESRGALESAHRIRTIAGQVFRYAVATGRAERDPSADLKGALPQPKETHRAAIVDPKEVAPLLRAMDGYQGHFVVMCALRLAPLFFVRPGELRHAEWTEIDFEQALWSIPAHKMKTKQAHIVPLCRQAVEILTELKEYTGNSRYVFPSGRSFVRPMSNNAILAALRRMGYDKDTMTGHGFRAMARTILDEVLNIRPDFIEHQLAHAVRDPNGRAYNRTAHLEERRKMMQTWADYLDGLKAGAVVLPFKNLPPR